MLKIVCETLENTRLRHVAIALMVASLLALTTILRPFDVAIWSLQSKMFDHTPSKSLVIVTDSSENFDGSPREANEQTGQLITKLVDAKAKLIVVNSRLRRSDSTAIDQYLRSILEQHQDQIILARDVSKDSDQEALTKPDIAFFERGMRVATSSLDPDFLGFVWGVQPSYATGNTSIPSVWNAIAFDGRAETAIYPDYTIDLDELTETEAASIILGDSNALSSVEGKTVLIDAYNLDRRSLNVPDGSDGDVSAALVQVIAAETAIRGAGQLIGSWVTIPVVGILLFAGLFLWRKKRSRRSFYAALLLIFACAIILSAYLGMRVMFAEALSIVAVFAITRATFNYRRRHLYINPRSHIPNFEALRRDLNASIDLEKNTIAVAKIARLDAILATLNDKDQGRFMNQIASRLSLGDTNTTVYNDGGKYFCFLFLRENYADLQSHLEGLRAIVSQAITLSGRTIDVSMTIGVDQSEQGSASNRISQAIAAADQAREAYRPVFIITNFEADSETWDYSLQSRLEDALSENRINIKLQPQMDLKTGLFSGAEALARWSDEMRGEIPPNQFIPQCERVGRLDQLTQRVLRLSMETSHSLMEQDLPARVSVNVSAIQFVDHRIADLVEKTLLETGANPENIVIEITESARISSVAMANDVMKRMSASKIKFSIDDFGVTSANLDTLHQLPFSELKIDRMFANFVLSDPSARAITTNLIKLSKDLGLTSVVEGIDDFSALEVLKGMGADRAQGFVIARPQTVPLLRETLRLQRDTITLHSNQG